MKFFGNEREDGIDGYKTAIVDQMHEGIGDEGTVFLARAGATGRKSGDDTALHCDLHDITPCTEKKA